MTCEIYYIPKKNFYTQKIPNTQTNNNRKTNINGLIETHLKQKVHQWVTEVHYNSETNVIHLSPNDTVNEVAICTFSVCISHDMLLW